MPDAVITVENLSKRYRIGQRERLHTSLRAMLSDLAMAPVRNLRRLWRLTHFERQEGDDILWALRDVSFEVRQGEVVGIIGRNGAGKSTLLKILSRIVEPTSGRAVLNGRVGSLLEVGTGFHPELTGRDNIYLSGALLGMRKREIEKKFDEIVAFSEVEKFIDTPVKKYSSGMYVRLAFGVAAHLDPEILLVDEVLAVGDASFQKKCLGKMGEVASEGRTVLFVSHNMSAVNSLCQRAVLLDAGGVELDDQAGVVVRRYLARDGGATGQAVWASETAPGNDEVRLVSLTLTDEVGRVTPEITIHAGALATLEFEILREGTRPVFSLVLFDAGSACVFGSLSNSPENELHGQPLRPGRYRATCRLAGDLLNDGDYSISIIGIDSFFRSGFRAENALQFKAIDDGVLKRDYHGSFGGPIRPRLVWSMERI